MSEAARLVSRGGPGGCGPGREADLAGGLPSTASHPRGQGHAGVFIGVGRRREVVGSGHPDTFYFNSDVFLVGASGTQVQPLGKTQSHAVPTARRLLLCWEVVPGHPARRRAQAAASWRFCWPGGRPPCALPQYHLHVLARARARQGRRVFGPLHPRAHTSCRTHPAGRRRAT